MLSEVDILKEQLIGFIGLGRMGFPMARNLLRKYKLVVWNRTRSKAEKLADIGAQVANTPREVAEKTNVVITMLAKPEVTRAVVLGLGEYEGKGVIEGLSAGKVLVNMATDPPELARELARKAAERRANYVSAPVLGSVVHAEKAMLTILADGNPEVVDEIKPVLKTMGQKVIYVGETGTANTMKILMNMHLLVATVAFSEVLLLGERMGITADKVVEVFNNSVFRSYVTEYKGPQMAKRDWTPHFTLNLAAKDLSLALSEARRTQTPLLLASIARELLDVALAKGWGELDFSAVFRIYESMIKRE